MNYYHLKSVVSAGKTPFAMKSPSESFNIPEKRRQAYIEPSFSRKIKVERPPIILISAVGATGKSALAQVLSNETGLPLLDLGKHKPVGDNTLTGLLTNSFNVQDLSAIFEGMSSGTFGVIIDGIDEGRSKTSEKAFEAFLDDIIRLSSTATNTSIVLLGRSQILDDCWVYLDDKGIEAGLITISPFSLDQAKKYIDSYANAHEQQYFSQYQEARDLVLSKLDAAFKNDNKDDDTNFMSFIGYPPEKSWDTILNSLTFSQKSRLPAFN